MTTLHNIICVMGIYDANDGYGTHITKPWFYTESIEDAIRLMQKDFDDEEPPTHLIAAYYVTVFVTDNDLKRCLRY